MHDLPLHQRLITRKQLEFNNVKAPELNLMIREGKLIKLRRSVFANHDEWKSAYPSERYIAECHAWAIAAQRIVFSHESAAALLGLPLLKIPGFIFCYCRPESRGSAKKVRFYPRLDESTRLTTSSSGLVCTDYLTTVNDCCRKLDLYSGLVIAESALNRGILDSVELRRILNEKGHGSKASRAIAKMMSSLSESPGETLLMARIREFGLPRPRQQYLVEVPWDGQRFRLDAAYPRYKLALEFDGAVKMTKFGPTDEVLVQERHREKALQNMGWTVLRFSWDQVMHRPQEVNAILKNALTRARLRSTS